MESAIRGAEPATPVLGAPPAPPTVLDLPAAVELLVFSQLSASELAACMATCRAWRQSAAAPELWQAACEQRWRSGGSTGQLAALARQGRWLELYRLRRQADARTLALLAELQDPERRRAALAQLRQAGNFSEATDVLQQLMAGAEGLRQPVLPGPGPESASAALTAAGSPAGPASASSALAWADAAEGSEVEARWPDAVAAATAGPCAAAYWAHSVHSELCVQHWAQRMRSVATRAAAAQQELSRRRSRPAEARGAAASTAQTQPDAEPPLEQQPAAGAAEPPGADASGAGGGQGQGHEEEQQGGGDASLAGLPEEQLELLLGLALEEGALALAHVHSPRADLGWVREALDALGQELRRRMQAQGAGAGGLPALRILTHLLFGEGPPPQHRRFCAIPPPDGHGLALRGNRERYYDPKNSLLDAVLTNREGLPISLALLLAAVGARAGLHISLLNVPMHVVCAMDLPAQAEPGGAAPGGPPARVYVDAFDGGRVMDSREFAGFLRSLGLLPSHIGDAQAMSAQQVWLRMCRNLLHVHREHAEHGLLKATALLMAAAAGEGTAEGVRACVEAANACLAQQQYDEAAELLEKLVGSPYQLQHGNGAALHEAALRAMLAEIRVAGEESVQKQLELRRRSVPGSQEVRFRVGQLLRHRRYQYRGVIVGWDLCCRASEEWMQQMGVDRLPGGRSQPFYHVLPDPADRPGQAQTYVAQENITLEPLPALHACKPGYALHPEVGLYFTALQPDGAAYRPAPWLARSYPDD